jgi:dephospho-CoA kinase
LKTKRVGLTGGIASGKSTVEHWLQSQGTPVIDADAVVHDLQTNDPAVKQAIIALLGDEAYGVDGELNRPWVADKVFSQPVLKKQLEAILHPRVRQAIEAFFVKQEDVRVPVAVASIPLLFEGGLEGQFDETWLVACSPFVQLERLMMLRGYSAKQAEARIKAQWPLEQKTAKATHVVWNNDNEETLYAQLEPLLR